jgi:hypothetical protein
VHPHVTSPPLTSHHACPLVSARHAGRSNPNPACPLSAQRARAAYRTCAARHCCTSAVVVCVVAADERHAVRQWGGESCEAVLLRAVRRCSTGCVRVVHIRQQQHSHPHPHLAACRRGVHLRKADTEVARGPSIAAIAAVAPGWEGACAERRPWTRLWMLSAAATCTTSIA